MIRTLLTLDALPGHVPDVLEMYKVGDILQYSLDHSEALASEISVATDGSNQVLVTAVWPNTAAYDGWLSNPNRVKTAPGLADILKDSRIGVARIFEIDHAVSR